VLGAGVLRYPRASVHKFLLYSAAHEAWKPETLAAR
jgi:hypothetical protein